MLFFQRLDALPELFHLLFVQLGIGELPPLARSQAPSLKRGLPSYTNRGLDTTRAEIQ